ncbi:MULTISPECIES: hypothetical protein [Pseudomonas]|uniref:hypothetical protein n=1 Tax=Pseudomonas TaxID=286 RepID=UPI001F26DCCB|nr:hypothetical protein [Pseudomonas monteilii]
MKQTNWTVIGVARWYDWKLGKLSDRDLAKLVGTSEGSIRRRRVQFGIEVYSVAVAIAPYQHLLGLESDRSVSAKSGVSVKSIQAYRESQGIAPRSKVTRRSQRLPLDHPVRPYKSALGLVPDEDIAQASGVAVEVVQALREAFGLDAVAPSPDLASPAPVEDYHGPGLGYESLLGTMSAAKLSRTVGVAYAVVEARRQFLGIAPYKRVSRADRYVHLFGVVPNSVLAKLAGVSHERIAQMRMAKGL